MPDRSVASLIDHLERSELLAADQLAQVKRQFAEQSDPRNLAKALVRSGLITRWQVQQLLAGRHTFELGKYRLLDKLGEGGMGAVYKAEQIGLGRIVALKVISQKQLDNPTAVGRFLREVRAVAALHHPNIVAAYDADCVGSQYFLVMEYVAGRDLNQWIKQFGRLPIDWACECALQSAQGLQHAHERGMVHRDIKPGNLLVLDDELGGVPAVKILDMGLARMIETDDEEGEELTQTGQVIGTTDYIAPEQARNTKASDIRADIFSLGCTLFKLLTGEVPFGGANAVERLMARASETAPLVSSLREEVPRKLDAVIAKMLARKPEDRYQTPAEVAAALSPFALSGEAESDSSLILPRELQDSLSGDADPDPGLAAFLDHLATDDDAATGVAAVETMAGAAPPPTHNLDDTLEGAEPAETGVRRVPAVAWLGGLAVAFVLVMLAWFWPESLASEPVWPGDAKGLIFAWRDPHSPNQVFDPRTGKPRACRLQPRGDARFTQHAMQLSGGAMLIDDYFAEWLLGECRSTGELTIEVIVAPANLTQGGPARIVTFSQNSGPRNFTLGQEQEQLVLRLRTSESGPSPSTHQLYKFENTMAAHVIASYRPGECVCYVNGQQVADFAAFQGDLGNWDLNDEHLLLGDEWTGERDWSGELRNVAIYARFTTAEQAQRQYTLAKKDLAQTQGLSDTNSAAP